MISWDGGSDADDDDDDDDRGGNDDVMILLLTVVVWRWHDIGDRGGGIVGALMVMIMRLSGNHTENDNHGIEW